jgi:hypothetical protein
LVTYLLSTNFSCFFNKKNFVFKYQSDKFPLKNANKISHVYENNNILFCHDFDDNFELSYQLFVEKYKRRINRLYNLIKSDKSIHFIRYEKSINQNYNNNLIDLISVIKNINPKCNFKLSFIGTSNKIDTIPITTNLYMDTNKHLDWTKDKLDWPLIFDIDYYKIKNINTQNFLTS